MSRHGFQAKDGIQWTVGWDPAVASYFAQHEVVDPPPWDVDPVDVVGNNRIGEVLTVAQLVHALDGQVEIPESLVRELASEGPRDPAAAAVAVVAATSRLSDAAQAVDAASAQRPTSFWGPAKASTAVLTDARAAISSTVAADQHRSAALHVDRGPAAGLDR